MPWTTWFWALAAGIDQRPLAVLPIVVLVAGAGLWDRPRLDRWYGQGHGGCAAAPLNVFFFSASRVVGASCARKKQHRAGRLLWGWPLRLVAIAMFAGGILHTYILHYAVTAIAVHWIVTAAAAQAVQRTARPKHD